MLDIKDHPRTIRLCPTADVQPAGRSTRPIDRVVALDEERHGMLAELELAVAAQRRQQGDRPADARGQARGRGRAERGDGLRRGHRRAGDRLKEVDTT